MLLLAMGVLLAFAARLAEIAKDVDRAIYLNRWIEKKETITLVCDEVDRYVTIDDDWLEYDYASSLLETIHVLDAHPGVYVALFSDDMRTLSKRIVVDGEAEVTPLSDPEFLSAVASGERGELMIPYVDASGRGHIVPLYFRWIPEGWKYSSRLLVVAAMSPKVLEQSPTRELIGWCVALLAVAALAVVTVVAIVTSAPEPKPEVKKSE
jgi:hypothetical protein